MGNFERNKQKQNTTNHHCHHHYHQQNALEFFSLKLIDKDMAISHAQLSGTSTRQQVS